jgi:hypothetical protein
MIISNSFNIQSKLLPYNGNTINFLAKNLKITSKNVFVLLSAINIKSDEFVLFIINERLKNRLRKTIIYS